MKKFLFILATVTIFNSNVFAETHSDIDNTSYQYDETTPRYIAIISPSNDLTISSGKANCYGYTKTRVGYRAKVKVELQRKDSNWTTLKTWVVSGSSTSIISENYTLNKGYSYRVKTTHYALNSSGSVIESVVLYSSTLSY